VFQHAMKTKQELSHGGDDGDHLGFAAGVDQVAVALGEDLLVTDGDECWHVKGRAHIAVAGLAMAINTGAGLAWARVETGVGHPLRSIHGGI
jgi:hypothetical protein